MAAPLAEVHSDRHALVTVVLDIFGLPHADRNILTESQANFGFRRSRTIGLGETQHLLAHLFQVVQGIGKPRRTHK